RAGQHGRRARRHARIPHDLRGRLRAVRRHLRDERSELSARATFAEEPMTARLEQSARPSQQAADARRSQLQQERVSMPPGLGNRFSTDKRSRTSEHVFYALALSAVLLPLLILLVLLWGVTVN